MIISRWLIVNLMLMVQWRVRTETLAMESKILAAKGKNSYVLTSLINLGESFVKEVCCGFFAILSWFVNWRKGRDTNRPAKMALICQEFFHRELGGFGGYGMAVKNLTDYYNSGRGGLKADVVLLGTSKEPKEPLLKRMGNTDVVVVPRFIGLLLHPLKFVKILAGIKPLFLLSMEYLVKYEYVLWVMPRVPLVVYIRDPRAEREWKKLESVLDTHNGIERDRIRLRLRTARQAISFKRVLRWSRWQGRAVIFATQAEYLIERARRKFRLKHLCSYILPNPVPLPKLLRIEDSPKPMLLVLSRLALQKRPWIAFELARRLPEVEFIIAGETRSGSFINQILAEYKNLSNLKFLGLVVDKMKSDLLRQCWALINTSIHEGLPVSFLEAFSYGKCVISCQDPDGLVERFGFYTGECPGWGLDEITLSRFVRRIQECLSDENQRRMKGLAARRHVEKIHSFESFDRHLKKLLKVEGLMKTDS